MIKAVLDTNLIVSASFHLASIPAQVLDAWLDKQYHLIISPAVTQEYRQVLFRERIRKRSRWSVEDTNEFLTRISRASEIQVPGKLAISASRDADDNKFLVAAVEGKADYIVTGDDDLLILHPFRNIKIIRPAEFLKTVKD